MNFALIAAVDQHFGLGKDNKLPWNLPSELKHFSEITKKVTDFEHENAVIMGRRTWESLPEKSKPLAERINVVLSRDVSKMQLPEKVIGTSSLDEALKLLSNHSNLEKIFVIGGGKIFEEAIHHPSCETIYLTILEQIFDCDTFFPSIDPKKFQLIDESPLKEENELSYRYRIYRKNS